MYSIISQVPEPEDAAHSQLVADEFFQFADHSTDCSHFSPSLAKRTLALKGAHPARPWVGFESLAEAEDDSLEVGKLVKKRLDVGGDCAPEVVVERTSSGRLRILLRQGEQVLHDPRSQSSIQVLFDPLSECFEDWSGNLLVSALHGQT